MNAETRKEALEWAKWVFRARRRLLFGPRFSEDVKHESELVPPSKAWEITLKAACEECKECPVSYDLLVAYGAECLRRSVLPPPWLAQFIAAHLSGEVTRPKSKGPNKKNLRGRNLALAMAVREVADEYNLPIKTSDDDSDSAVSVVCDAVKALEVHVEPSTVYNAYSAAWDYNKKAKTV